MQVKVSTKYQIVIPKSFRRKLGIKPGQKVTVKESGNTITLEPTSDMRSLLDQAAGTLKDTPWQKEGIDAAQWLRKQRDSEWD